VLAALCATVDETATGKNTHMNVADTAASCMHKGAKVIMLQRPKSGCGYAFTLFDVMQACGNLEFGSIN